MTYQICKTDKILSKLNKVLCLTVISVLIQHCLLDRAEAKVLTNYSVATLTSSPVFQASQNSKRTSSKSQSWLERSFEERSINWILISSLIGGLVGASAKLIFEVILPARLKERREIISLTHKYTTPILLATEALRNRLFNMINLIELVEKDQWLSCNNQTSPPQPTYYYLSTIYLLGRFFGWVEILRSTVVYLDLASVRETRRFERYLEAIESCFSDPEILPGITDIKLRTESNRDWCYSYELSAIGEMMIVRDSHDDNLKTIGFAGFKKLFLDSQGSDFREYFDCLALLFKDLKKSEARFKRIIVAHAILNAFIDYMDSNHIRTDRQENCLSILKPNERASIEEKIRQLHS
jgi:hypothetical protein